MFCGGRSRMCRQLGYVFVYVGFLGILCGLPDWLLWKCRHCNFLLSRLRRFITVCMSEGCGSARFAFRNGPFCAAILPVSSANMVHSVTLHGRSVPGKCLSVKSFPRPLALASGCLCRVVVARLLPVVARLAMAACGFHSMLSMLTPSYSFRNSAILLSYCVRFTFISIDTLYLFPSGECCSFML